MTTETLEILQSTMNITKRSEDAIERLTTKVPQIAKRM
jgi:hypothetical protein